MMDIFLLTATILVLFILIRRLSTGHTDDVQLSQAMIEAALYRLGNEAADAGETITLIVVGGTAMLLGYQARYSTQDVDAYFVVPPERRRTRQWSAKVARDLNLPTDWLNDAAKGFMQGVSRGPLLLAGRGIMVYQVAPEQLLAMKLAAWRDERDQIDAAVVLRALRGVYPSKSTIWEALKPFLTIFELLKAWYAFEELWENLDANNQ